MRGRRLAAAGLNECQHEQLDIESWPANLLTCSTLPSHAYAALCSGVPEPPLDLLIYPAAGRPLLAP